MDDLLREFLTESAENLLAAERELIELERRPDDADLIASIFRSVHTIKGTCGFLGLTRLEAVAHAAENVLGSLRDGELDASPEVVSDVLAAVDTVKEILDGLEAGEEEPMGDDSDVIERLNSWLGDDCERSDEALDLLFRSARAATGAEPIAALEPRDISPADRPAAAGRAVADATLRVDVDVLDLLMNLAGELVLTRNQLVRLAQREEDSEHHASVQQLNRVTTHLQEAVMKTRMQPIGNAWGKLPRLVRDLAGASAKQLDLRMLGAETELDRQILQAIKDPLTHMVRNSADHGIEDPETRARAGKSETGHIVLEAFHEGGHIVIEIRDDGRGLDADAIRRKAVERGLVPAEEAATLPDHRVLEYIFQPGFSTASKVTSVSGRGVGMDVVRRNIERIGGTIELHSTLGKGTTVRVKIPLTLAIMSSLVVGVRGQSFAVPQIGVVELVRVGDAARGAVDRVSGSLFYRLRDRLLPLVRLDRVLGYAGGGDEVRNVVVCQVGASRFGLVVDTILDTQEIVVKPVGRMVKGVRAYAGTTILGDGRVIMILDIPGIAQLTDVLSRGRDGEGDAEEAVRDGRDGSTSMLLFDAGVPAPRAVPLGRVSRLEEVRREDIEWVDGRWVIQYRGRLLPVIPASEGIAMHEDPTRPVIVFTDGVRSFGMAVERIRDIVQEVVTIEEESATPGLVGCAVLAGRTTEIVDVDRHLARIGEGVGRATRGAPARWNGDGGGGDGGGNGRREGARATHDPGSPAPAGREVLV